jgi:hypothetical protein
MPLAIRAAFVLSEEKNPYYSLLRQMNSLLRRQTFPAPIGREFMYKALKLLRELASRIAKPVKKNTNSLLFSLPAGNSRGHSPHEAPFFRRAMPGWSCPRHRPPRIEGREGRPSIRATVYGPRHGLISPHHEQGAGRGAGGTKVGPARLWHFEMSKSATADFDSALRLTARSSSRGPCRRWRRGRLGCSRATGARRSRSAGIRCRHRRGGRYGRARPCRTRRSPSCCRSC